MKTDLQHRLLEIEAESFDPHRPEDVYNDPQGEHVFGRYCQDVLAAYRDFFPGISRGWVSVAGIRPGVLTAIAAYPEQLKNSIPELTREEGQALGANGPNVRHPSNAVYLQRSAGDAKQVWLVPLIRCDEQYGILAFASDIHSYFSDVRRTTIENSLPLLNRLMAEAAFSKRLKTLAAPFAFGTSRVSLDHMYDQIAQRACLGLAADGSVLRIRKPSGKNGYTLDVMGSYGLLAGSEQLAPDSVFERICRQVFESDRYFVTVRTLTGSSRQRGFGVEIGDDDERQLQSFGIQAYMIMRLQSDLWADNRPSVIGTLSVFHRLPQKFSGRDISLYRGYCERIADDLSLLEQRDENEEISKLLQVQNSSGTRAEITALMGHDFGHRVYHVQSNLQDFIEICTKNWPNRTLPDKIRIAADELTKNCDELAGIVKQIRLLGVGAEEPPVIFNVGDVFSEIESTLRTVFERTDMTIEKRCQGDCKLKGVRGILLQALFNLVINAIDAQRVLRASGGKKRNGVHLSCRELGAGPHRKLEIKVWDDGPGISWTVFPDAQKIFDIGATSKPAGVGTGTGLPAARSLLGRYFGADLQLVDRSKALFQFFIAAPATN